jgi:hypothetical protein
MGDERMYGWFELVGCLLQLQLETTPSTLGSVGCAVVLLSTEPLGGPCHAHATTPLQW